MKKQNGITMITLIITIIVMLILAGAAISMVIGDGSVIDRATSAAEKTRASEINEKIVLAKSSNYLIKYTNVGTKQTKETIVEELYLNNKLMEDERNKLLGENGETEVDSIVIEDVVCDFSGLDESGKDENINIRIGSLGTFDAAFVVGDGGNFDFTNKKLNLSTPLKNDSLYNSEIKIKAQDENVTEVAILSPGESINVLNLVDNAEDIIESSLVDSLNYNIIYYESGTNNIVCELNFGNEDIEDNEINIVANNTMNLVLSDKKINANFSNNSDYNALVQILIADTVISQSSSIAPDASLENLDLISGMESALSEGTYDVSYRINFYDTETNERKGDLNISTNIMLEVQ